MTLETKLLISDAALAAMKAHGESGYPHEVCGLLVGRFADEMRIRQVLRAAPAHNLNTERAADRYELSPEDYRRIEIEALRDALEVVGIYHTHPDHPSRASEADRQRAVDVWQDQLSWSYLIFEVAQGRVASYRSWVLHNEQFQAEECQVQALGEQGD
jgi:proteasome lid subunit RPN8/RPN11